MIADCSISSHITHFLLLDCTPSAEVADHLLSSARLPNIAPRKHSASARGPPLAERERSCTLTYQMSGMKKWYRATSARTRIAAFCSGIAAPLLSHADL